MIELELRADGTVGRYDTSALDLLINEGTASPGVGSWMCRSDGKLVVTILRAGYAPLAAGPAPAYPNADVTLSQYIRSTYLFSVDNVNTLTQLQVRNRFYAPDQNPTDPAATSILGGLVTVPGTFTRFTASDADLLLP